MLVLILDTQGLNLFAWQALVTEGQQCQSLESHQDVHHVVEMMDLMPFW